MTIFCSLNVWKKLSPDTQIALLAQKMLIRTGGNVLKGAADAVPSEGPIVAFAPKKV